VTAPTSQRVRKSFLLAGAAVLLVLAVVLLVLLHGPARDGTGGVVSSTGAERRATEPSPSTTSRTPPLLPHAAAAARGQAPPPPSSGSGSGSASPPPSVAHASAPPAIPTEIQNERDPKRKAELLKMHKLATARVRVSMLRHRANLLRIAIEKGRRDGSWSAEKVREAEASLRQLTTGIAGAQQDLDQVRTEVGGDIDRD
jgi:hypothetical protein